MRPDYQKVKLPSFSNPTRREGPSRPGHTSEIQLPQAGKPSRQEPQLPRPKVAQSKIVEPQVPKLQPQVPHLTTASQQAAQLQTAPVPLPPPETTPESTPVWEFKVVRAKSAIFQKSATLTRLSQTEAKNGWLFVEKLDNQRVRFKRLVPSHSVPLPKPVESFYSVSSSGKRHRLFWSLAFLAAIVLPAVLAYRFVSSSLAPPKLPPSYYPESPAASPDGQSL